MQVIHFTDGATDPLQAFRSERARLVPLADGAGEGKARLSVSINQCICDS